MKLNCPSDIGISAAWRPPLVEEKHPQYFFLVLREMRFFILIVFKIFWLAPFFFLPPQIFVLGMMLHYADIDYNDVSYTSMDSWFKEGKPALIEKNPLINLPWVQYKGEVVTQSNAVLLFIGRVAKLNGSTESEINRNEQILCQTFDLRNKVVDIVYSPTGSEKVDEHFSGMVNTHYTKLKKNLANKIFGYSARCEGKLCI